jgi:hypothetical protein
MAHRKRIAQGLAVLGSVILFLSAAFHGIAAFPQISAALRASGLAAPLIRAMLSIWEMAAWHWLGLGIVTLVACFARSGPRRLILFLCGIMSLGDAIGGYAAVGPFIGDELLTAAGISILAAAVLLPTDI